jgi:hypothetical protein
MALPRPDRDESLAAPRAEVYARREPLGARSACPDKEFSHERSFGRGDADRHFRLLQPTGGDDAPACKCRFPTGDQRAGEPGGVHRAAAVLAVAVVARGADIDLVRRAAPRQRTTPTPSA